MYRLVQAHDKLHETETLRTRPKMDSKLRPGRSNAASTYSNNESNCRHLHKGPLHCPIYILT